MQVRIRNVRHSFRFWLPDGTECRAVADVPSIGGPSSVPSLADHLARMSEWMKATSKPYADTLDAQGRDTKAKAGMEVYSIDVGACLTYTGEPAKAEAGDGVDAKGVTVKADSAS